MSFPPEPVDDTVRRKHLSFLVFLQRACLTLSSPPREYRPNSALVVPSPRGHVRDAALQAAANLLAPLVHRICFRFASSLGNLESPL